MNPMVFWSLIGATYITIEAIANVVFFVFQKNKEKVPELDSLFQLGRLLRLACGILILWFLYGLVVQ